MFLNPAVLYAVTWTAVLLLYSLRLSNLLDPLSGNTVLLVGGTAFAFIGGWIAESFPHHGRLAKSSAESAVLRTAVAGGGAKRKLQLVWIAFLIGISIEIIAFGGTPFTGLIGLGARITYIDFGFHGFHGFVNALFFAGCMIAFARILLGASKRSWLLALMSCTYPLLMMSREVLISLLLQYIFIYLSIRRPSVKLFIKVGIIITAIFFAFGYLGDLRTGRNNIIAVGAPSFEYPDWLPSAFIWVYIYMCTPLANVNNNISVVPHHFPLETAGSFIPSFAREGFLNSFGGATQWNLVNDALNANSLLQSLLVDFGISGAIIFAFCCGVVFSSVLRRSRRSAVAFFAVVILLHGVALSFFANLLFQPIFVFEIFVIGWVVSGGYLNERNILSNRASVQR